MIEINDYQAIVVGAGHAGCESALALARKGIKTVLMTLSLDAIAFLACNPSVGGTAKGQLVSEIDALGGEMAINADKTCLQIRILNSAKGVAVQSLREQCDKITYHNEMKKTLEKQKNLHIRQAEVSKILVKDGKFVGVQTLQGEKYNANVVVLCTGVYLKSRIIIGEFSEKTGPNGFKNANYLTDSLIELGFNIKRFKTGTPPRIYRSSMNTTNMEIQNGDELDYGFSYLTNKPLKNKSVCYLTYTTDSTKQIILNNLDRSPMFSGQIKGIGPRYCPSIEDKIVRFSEKERHQLFLEPESLCTDEVYIQGLSSSMPIEIQRQIVHSVRGLENAVIMRDAYAIEYDAIDSLQLLPTLAYKNIKGIYLAGQINGTSGYEEAAAQGVIAGINAGQYVKNKEELVLKRNDGYIGVLIDDLVTKGTNEPYRMMTSRAEYRLLLRQDNADLRLTEIGRKFGLVSDKRYKTYLNKINEIKKCQEYFDKIILPNEINKKIFESFQETMPQNGIKIKDAIKRKNLNSTILQKQFGVFENISKSVLTQIDTQVKYEGYICRQNNSIEKMISEEKILIPQNIDYSNIKGLRIEARQKLSKIQPATIGQASRISGVSPADISVLLIVLKSKK